MISGYKQHNLGWYVVPTLLVILGSILFGSAAATELVNDKQQNFVDGGFDGASALVKWNIMDLHTSTSLIGAESHSNFASPSGFGNALDQVLFFFANMMAATYYAHKNIRILIIIGKFLIKFFES